MSPRRFSRKEWQVIAGLAGFLSALEAMPALASVAKSPEQETLEISKHLHPIADEEWQNIAGEKISEKYTIVKTDTLSDISNRLFGDPKYWPKLWAINHDAITNPHMIFPGNLLAFMGGSGSSLPAVTLDSLRKKKEEETATDAAPDALTRSLMRGRSKEWKKLPPQAWEAYQVQMPPEIDPLGFDKRSKVVFHAEPKLELPAIASSGIINPTAFITAAKNPGEFLSPSDQVFIKPNDGANLRVGEIYAVTREPITLQSPGRVGYSYLILGTVKITATEQDVIVGEILSGRDSIDRNSFLIPLPDKIQPYTPIPGPEAMDATVLLDHNFSTFDTAQHKFVFLDRGSDDGIKPGMIFRSYIHEDPMTSKQISASDFVKIADFMVLQCSEKHSIALIVSSALPVAENTTAVLLTDVSDVDVTATQTTNGGTNVTVPVTPPAPQPSSAPSAVPTPETKPSPVPSAAPTPEPAPSAEVPKQSEDELDKLDNGGGVGKDEEKELKQLEKWKGNHEPAPESAPSPTSAPEGLPGATMDKEVPPTAPAPAPDESLDTPSSEKALDKAAQEKSAPEKTEDPSLDGTPPSPPPAVKDTAPTAPTHSMPAVEPEGGPELPPNPADNAPPTPPPHRPSDDAKTLDNLMQ